MPRYLHCRECGFTRLSAPASIAGTCPSCRRRGRLAYMDEVPDLPRLAGELLNRMRDPRLQADDQTSPST
ncbi:MAG TPA: hypothetical protein VK326_07340 [Solirubrobacterales bacterium]|nr:hypothetical protein [Solirubrobacterales bacterium]